MPRKNKATLARLANFPKAPPKSYRTTVEDASDSESDSEDSEYRPNTRSTTLTTPDNDDDRGEALKVRFFVLEDDFLEEDDAPELDDVSDSDPEEFGLDDDEEAEIQDDVRLLNFSRVLQRAQEIAAEAEREK